MPDNNFFSKEAGYPFFLLLFLVIFNSLRPDTLLPGGKVLTYVPTLLTFLLLIKWIGADNKILQNPQTKFFIAILVLMLIQVPFARNLGFTKLAIKNMFIYIFPLYLVMVQFIDTPYRLNRYIRLFTILGVFFALLGIFGAGKISVYILEDENDFCLLMNVMLPFAVFLCWEAKQFKKKLFYFILALMYLGGNISTLSRGGFLGLAAVVFYLFTLSKHKMVFIALAVVVGIGTITFAPPKYLEEIRSIDTSSYKRDTGATRIDSWKAGWRMFLDNPIIGVGAYNFGPNFSDYWDQGRNPDKMWGRVAHSLYFTLLPEMGLVGVICFIGMLFYSYNDYRFVLSLEKIKESQLASSSLPAHEKEELLLAIRRLYFFSCASMGAMVAYLVTGFFISVLWYDYFWKLTAYSVIMRNIAVHAESLLHSSDTPSG